MQLMSDTPLSVALLIVGELRGFLPDGWRGFERHVVRVLRREAANVDTFICTDSVASLPDDVTKGLRVVSTLVGAAAGERDRLAQCFHFALHYERQAAERRFPPWWSHVLRARPDQSWLADMPALTQLEPDAISLRARMLAVDGAVVTADHMSWYSCGLLAGASHLEPTCAPSNALALQRLPCALADDQWAVVPRRWASVYFLGDLNAGAAHGVSTGPSTSTRPSTGNANATLLRIALSSEQFAACGSCFEAVQWPEGRLMQRLVSHHADIAIAPFRFRVASRACGERGTNGAPLASSSACAYDEAGTLAPPNLPTYDCGLGRWRWAMEKGAAAAALRRELERWRGGNVNAALQAPIQATGVRPCRHAFKLERHIEQHGDVCRARDGSGNFVCPHGCVTAEAPFHCRHLTGSATTLSPCRYGGATAAARPRPPRESYRTMAELFEATGYVTLPNALSRGRVEAMAAAVRDHLLEHGDEHSRVLCPVGHPCGARVGGWYVAAFEQHERLAPIFDDLVGHASLRDALQKLLGPHRILARNEVYVNRWGSWHKDRTYAALRLYERESRPPRDVLSRIARSGFSAESFEAWRVARATANETRRVVTVTVYLQDHRSNQQALAVQPGTHREDAGESPLLPEETTLHPALGDLLLFDSDLTHRAMRPEAVVQQALSPTTRLNRTAISLSFGTLVAPHATEAFERGFALRSALLGSVNRTLCRTAREDRYDDLSLEHPCAYAAAVADLLLRPVDIHRAARRRRPYAFPSHDKLCTAVARQGASQRIGSVPGLQQGLLRTLGCGVAVDESSKRLVTEGTRTV